MTDVILLASAPRPITARLVWGTDHWAVNKCRARKHIHTVLHLWSPNSFFFCEKSEEAFTSSSWSSGQTLSAPPSPPCGQTLMWVKLVPRPCPGNLENKFHSAEWWSLTSWGSGFLIVPFVFSGFWSCSHGPRGTSLPSVTFPPPQPSPQIPKWLSTEKLWWAALKLLWRTWTTSRTPTPNWASCTPRSSMWIPTTSGYVIPHTETQLLAFLNSCQFIHSCCILSYGCRCLLSASLWLWPPSLDPASLPLVSKRPGRSSWPWWSPPWADSTTKRLKWPTTEEVQRDISFWAIKRCQKYINKKTQIICKCAL